MSFPRRRESRVAEHVGSGFPDVIPAQAGIQGPPTQYALHAKAKRPGIGTGNPRLRWGI